MTWIVGRTIPFGYAVALSDIRVTLRDGSEVDGLQKIYAVGPFIALGFAGSVAIGFSMVHRLRQLLGPIPPDMAWEPDVVAQWWPEYAREVFSAFPKQEQFLGCHLLMAGVHPSRNNGEAPWAIAYVYRFRSPEFVPLLAGSKIVSIGSGEAIEEYSKVLQRIGTGFDYLKMEINNPGGSAFGLLHMVTSAVKDIPKRGISRNLHVCIVMRGEIRLAANNRRYIGDSSEDIIMPPVAQSLSELDQMLRDRGRTLALATC